ncbi:MAG: hypothetical protein GX962_13920 [Epulopiscium sp.]|nr:hypothetical protein [Candidatus Epulonipiscium sp.]
MVITLSFEDYKEMVEFAKTLLAGPTEEKVQTKEEPKKEDSTEKPETKQTDLTIEDVRALFVEKNNAKGNTAKLKAILTEFEVGKVTDLEEKDFEAVMQKLEEL